MNGHKEPLYLLEHKRQKEVIISLTVNFDVLCMKLEYDTFGLVLRMRQMVFNLKDFEKLWFLYQTEGYSEEESYEETVAQSIIDEDFTYS